MDARTTKYSLNDIWPTSRLPLTGILMYKCVNYIAPDYLCDLFCLNADIYQVNTITKSVIFMYQQSVYFSQSLSVYGSVLLNLNSL